MTYLCMPNDLGDHYPSPGHRSFHPPLSVSVYIVWGITLPTLSPEVTDSQPIWLSIGVSLTLSLSHPQHSPSLNYELSFHHHLCLLLYRRLTQQDANTFRCGQICTCIDFSEITILSNDSKCLHLYMITNYEN